MKPGGFAIALVPGAMLGFTLAGAAVHAIDPAASDARARLRAIVEDPALAVLAIEERLDAILPDETRTRIARAGVPVLVPFAWPSSAAGSHAGERYIEALVRDAIGYHVKLGAEAP
jgi:vacuolar-type H+-ATPase subunit F/Vma7